MKRKISILLVLFLSFVVIREVKAASSPETCETGTTCSGTFYTEYNKGIQPKSISGSDNVVVIYGESVCDANQPCTYTYAGGYKNAEDVLKRSVICTGNEDYISYVYLSSGGDGFKNKNEGEAFSGKVYWEEEYSVSCTSNSNGGNVVKVETPSNSGNINSGNSNSGNSNSGNSNSGNSNSGNSNSGNSNSGDNYGSSTTVPNPEQGVNTYFVILGLIAIGSYVFMIIVKKYNLFKKI